MKEENLPVLKHLFRRTPIRVLMTADTVGGVWTYVLELARLFQSLPVRIGLATMGRRLTATQRAAVEQFPSVTLFESEYRLEWMDDPWEDVERAGRWLLDVERRFEPDLIHLNGYVHGVLPWRAPVLIVGHSCVFSWFEAVRGEPPTPYWSRYYEEVKKGLHQATLVTAPTRAMLDTLLDLYGPFRAAKAVYNGRSVAAPEGTPKEPFVLTAGRLWDEAKNMHLVDRAAPGVNWPILAAGDIKKPDGGTALFEHLQTTGHLDYAQLLQLLARSSIYVLPALYEPFGLSALEAGLSRNALVLGDIPTLREVWGDTALYVDTREPESLKKILNELIEHPVRREQWAEKAYRRALRFTPERMAAGYLELYDQLLHVEHRRDFPARARSSGRSARIGSAVAD